MTTVGKDWTSGPERSIAIIASALLMTISSRASSSSTTASAASYIESASSTSPDRTLASALRRNSSARVNTCSVIPTLTLPIFRLAEFLCSLEFDEALDLFLRAGAERSQFVEHRLRAAALFEEIADAEVESLQNLQKRIEADLVFALLHPRKVRLMDADPLGELHLRQFALTAKLPDFPSDEFELTWLVHGLFVDFYAMEK